MIIDQTLMIPDHILYKNEDFNDCDPAAAAGGRHIWANDTALCFDRSFSVECAPLLKLHYTLSVDSEHD